MELHYKSNWSLRTSYVIGADNVKQNQLVEPTKVLMSFLHIHT